MPNFTMPNGVDVEYHQISRADQFFSYRFQTNTSPKLVDAIVVAGPPAAFNVRDEIYQRYSEWAKIMIDDFGFDIPRGNL